MILSKAELNLLEVNMQIQVKIIVSVFRNSIETVPSPLR